MATDSQLTVDECQELGGCHMCLIHGCAQESSAASIAPKAHPSTHLHPSHQQVLTCKGNQPHCASVFLYCKDKPPVPAALLPCPLLLWKLRLGELQPTICTGRTEAFGTGWCNTVMLPPTPSLPTCSLAEQYRAGHLFCHSAEGLPGDTCSPAAVSLVPKNHPSFSPHPSTVLLPLQHSRQCCLFTTHSMLAFRLKHEAQQLPAGFSFYLTKSQHNKKKRVKKRHTHGIVAMNRFSSK